jgi:hypothetical protein
MRYVVTSISRSADRTTTVPNRFVYSDRLKISCMRSGFASVATSQSPGSTPRIASRTQPPTT